MIISDPALQLVALTGMALTIVVCLVIMTGGIMGIIYNLFDMLLP